MSSSPVDPPLHSTRPPSTGWIQAPQQHTHPLQRPPPPNTTTTTTSTMMAPYDHPIQASSSSSTLFSLQSSSSSLPASKRSRVVIPSKRAAQNRAAQRAFRERRDKYIKDLEKRAKEMENWPEEMEQLRGENRHLRNTVAALERRIAELTGQTPISSNASTGSDKAIPPSSPLQVSPPISKPVVSEEQQAPLSASSISTTASPPSPPSQRLSQSMVSPSQTNHDIQQDDMLAVSSQPPPPPPPPTVTVSTAQDARGPVQQKIPLRPPHTMPSSSSSPPPSSSLSSSHVSSSDQLTPAHHHHHQQQQQHDGTPLPPEIAVTEMPSEQPDLWSGFDQFDLEFAFDSYFQDDFAVAGGGDGGGVPNNNATPSGDPLIHEYNINNSGQVLDDLFAMLQTRQRPEIPLQPTMASEMQSNSPHVLPGGDPTTSTTTSSSYMPLQ
ncbi:hypothetical protein K492DRAFT_240106 [Lichtheimia hyalospora FSU 10163]|nr:hypothetical protein K492DRAFT_240106 [Lichtheimia hyalospora FSU 10163]